MSIGDGSNTTSSQRDLYKIVDNHKANNKTRLENCLLELDEHIRSDSHYHSQAYQDAKNTVEIADEALWECLYEIARIHADLEKQYSEFNEEQIPIFRKKYEKSIRFLKSEIEKEKRHINQFENYINALNKKIEKNNDDDKINLFRTEERDICVSILVDANERLHINENYLSKFEEKKRSNLIPAAQSIQPMISDIFDREKEQIDRCVNAMIDIIYVKPADRAKKIFLRATKELFKSIPLIGSTLGDILGKYEFMNDIASSFLGQRFPKEESNLKNVEDFSKMLADLAVDLKFVTLLAGHQEDKEFFDKVLRGEFLAEHDTLVKRASEKTALELVIRANEAIAEALEEGPYKDFRNSVLEDLRGKLESVAGTNNTRSSAKL